MSSTAFDSYAIKDGTAYTEDGEPILKVAVYVSVKLTKEEVRKYFSRFGTVESVHLHQCKRDTVGFVKFKKGSSAANALQWETNALEEGEKYFVSANAALTRNKNGYQSYNLHLCVTPPKNTDIAKFTCRTLHEYCLEGIFDHLDMSELINFVRICPSYNDAFLNYCKRKCKHFDCDLLTTMTTYEMRYFFKNVGEHIENLTISVDFTNRPIYRFAKKFCKNVRCLVLRKCDLVPSGLRKFLSPFTNLKELNLACLGLTDKHMQGLICAKRLEILDLSWNVSIEGIYLKRLRQLKVLNLCGCFSLTPIYLTAICKSLQLQSLNICGAHLITRASLDDILGHCQELEVLKISYNETDSYECMTQLPKLKYLQLQGAEWDTDISWIPVLKSLVKYKSNQLETLKIVTKANLEPECVELVAQLKRLKMLVLPYKSAVNDVVLEQFSSMEKLQDINIKSCMAITNEGVLALLRCCKDLRYINIKYCSLIDIDLVTEAIKLLAPRKDMLARPVTLLADRTSITKNSLSCLAGYNEAIKTSILHVICRDEY